MIAKCVSKDRWYTDICVTAPYSLQPDRDPESLAGNAARVENMQQLVLMTNMSHCSVHSVWGGAKTCKCGSATFFIVDEA